MGADPTSLLPAEMMLPNRTLTARGAADGLINKCRQFGSRGMLVCGTSLARGGGLRRILGENAGNHDICTWRHPGGEPTLDQVEQLLSAARGHGADWVAAVGGGSVMDLAKACAGLLDAPAAPESYHDGDPIPASRIPFIAVPTTAGTGSEMTIVSVLTNTRTGVKKSIRHPSFMARLVILDADLLTTCSPAVIAASGMDALTQAIESYASRRATWVTDCCALQAARLIHAALPCVFDGDWGAPCDNLLLGSAMAGVALSNARLGLVHGLAHPLGARFHQPHGLVCAVCLPSVLAFNRDAMGERYATLSEIMDGDVLTSVVAMLDKLQLTSPFSGKRLDDTDVVVAETLASGSTAANPRKVTEADVKAILDGLFDASRSPIDPEHCPRRPATCSDFATAP